MRIILTKSAFFVVCFLLTFFSVVNSIEALSFVDLPYARVITPFEHKLQVQKALVSEDVLQKSVDGFYFGTKSFDIDRLDTHLKILALPPDQSRLYSRDGHLQTYREEDTIYPNILFTNNNWRSFNRVNELMILDTISISSWSESQDYIVNGIYRTSIASIPVTINPNNIYVFVDQIDSPELIIIELQKA